MRYLPVSAIVPTKNRPKVLRRTLESLFAQDILPKELIVIDASCSADTEIAVAEFAAHQAVSDCHVKWRRAKVAGAAAQRNEGMALAAQPVIWFFDDDILFEPSCVARLWQALQSDAAIGGVNAMIRNQCYLRPGTASRLMLRLMSSSWSASYAGRVLGPAVNLLPEDRDDLPDVVAVDWLNTTCTLYRREAVPDPPFPTHFVGYSMMEDLALSLMVAKHWKLANARTARIYHDSQPAPHKADMEALSRMELVNRHYVMTKIMARRTFRNYGKLALWELFQLLACGIETRLGPPFWQAVKGKLRGVDDIISRRKQVQS